MDECCFFTFLSSFLLFDAVGFSILLGLPLLESHLLIPYEESFKKIKKITKTEEIPLDIFPSSYITITVDLFFIVSLLYLISASLIMCGFLGWGCWWYGIRITMVTTGFTIFLVISFHFYRKSLTKTKLLIDFITS